MSIARPSTCFFCTFKQTSRRAEPIARRRFHASPLRSKPKQIPDNDDPVESLQPLEEKDIDANFTPAQAEVIKQTQKHLKFDQNYKRGTVANKKPWTMQYFQNLTEIDPLADKPVKAPWSNLDDNSRLKTDDEFNEDIVRFMQNMPEDEDEAAAAFQNFLNKNRITVGKESAEYNPRSAEAPSFPTIKRDEFRAGLKQAENSTVVSSATAPTTSTTAKKGGSKQDGVKGEISPALIRLMQMTGYTSNELGRLTVKSIIDHRVVNQTRLGKIQKHYWLSIAGNGNGLLGIGEGKSEESAEGMIQSQYRAIRNMQPIKRYEKRTIFGDVSGKSGATELELYARPPGFGLRCQQYIFEMCRAAGISDLAARVTRARNPMNTVKAAYQAMQSQKDPEEVAKGRGKKLVDVRKVYYAGNV